MFQQKHLDLYILIVYFLIKLILLFVFLYIADLQHLKMFQTEDILLEEFLCILGLQ